MISRVLLLAGLSLAGAGQALATQCGDLIAAIDQEYRLGVTIGEQFAAREVSSDSGTNALTSVPNTGGVQAPPPQLNDDQRSGMRAALQAAKQADEAGDGTTCANKVAEARRLAGQR